MIDFTDRLDALRERVAQAEVYLRVADLRRRRPQLESEMGRPDLWDDAELARKVQTELASVVDDLDVYDRLSSRLDDAATLYELALEEHDDSFETEIADALGAVETELDRLELRALFTGEYDEEDAVCTVKSGAGGTDAQDWAEMLLRMYRRWAENNGFALEIEAVTEGQEAGILSAEFTVKGRYAFGMLKAERGTHRLVRISPFDNQGRRQTSFAGVEILPVVEQTDHIEIDESELRVDVYRSSGPGGQGVNTTDSAVRLTHLPTGIVVSCQNERSQIQNKASAMNVLQAKLLERRRQEEQAAMDALKGDGGNSWGNQMRSYVLHPYQMVKDLRTEFEVGNPEAVFNGEIDGFLEAGIRWRKQQEK
jgi:peptide chain release factor 2